MTENPIPSSAFGAREAAARLLLVLAALAALVSGLTAAAGLEAVSVDARMAETWRAVGMAFFAGVFVVLAWRPRTSGGLWTITIASKIVLTVVGAVYALTGAAGGAGSSALADGLLVVVLTTSYLLGAAWKPAHPLGGAPTADGRLGRGDDPALGFESRRNADLGPELPSGWPTS